MTETKFTPEYINKTMKDMLKDPKSMSIWTEILIGNQIDVESNDNFYLTANKLASTLGIGKSVLYTRLSNLEKEKQVIEAEFISKDTENKKGVPEKIYKINRKFIDSFNEIVKTVDNQLLHIRDYRLFHLYVINSILMREIRLLSKKTNEDVAKTVNEDQFYGKIASLTKNEHDLLQKEIKKAYENLYEQKKEKKDEEEEKEAEGFLTFTKEYFHYSGFLKIKRS